MLMARRKMVLTICFNTSHVGIYLGVFLSKPRKKLFQYIPCCYLSIQRCKRGFRASYVSIHPMLLFIKCGSWERTSRFDVSIHPMLLFIPLKKEERELTQEFQYIPCCYLSTLLIEPSSQLACFNTSHVVIYLVLCHLTIHHRKFQYIPCCYLSFF